VSIGNRILRVEQSSIDAGAGSLTHASTTLSESGGFQGGSAIRFGFQLR
jgi:hypothetical protein